MGEVLVPDLDARMVFVGGPPRGGTTLAIRLLERHPDILGIIHDHVHEFWPLYYYGDRSGVVADLRHGVASEAVRKTLYSGLIREGWLTGIADAPHTVFMPISPPPERPDGNSLPVDTERKLHALRVDQIPDRARLCIKSPEISHVLPQLSSAFSGARFVIVFRPLQEIAESMFRRGNRVKRVEIFHRRWRRDEAIHPENAIPPGVPLEWESLWRDSDDFSRCVIYGASFLDALIKGVGALAPEICFVYDHAKMRRGPDRIMAALAHFLDIDPIGLVGVDEWVRRDSPPISSDLLRIYQGVSKSLGLESIYRGLTQRAQLSASN